MSETPVWMGIDVAKAWLDMARSDETAVRRFSNDDEGIAALVAALTTPAPQLVVLEATGGLEPNHRLPAWIAQHPLDPADPELGPLRLCRVHQGMSKACRMNLCGRLLRAQAQRNGNTIGHPVDVMLPAGRRRDDTAKGIERAVAAIHTDLLRQACVQREAAAR